MRTSLRRYNEDLQELEDRLAELRAAVVSELDETEAHLKGLKTTLEAIDRLVHSSRDPESVPLVPRTH
jgi:prefoldin subunit 5